MFYARVVVVHVTALQQQHRHYHHHYHHHVTTTIERSGDTFVVTLAVPTITLRTTILDLEWKGDQLLSPLLPLLTKSLVTRKRKQKKIGIPLVLKHTMTLIVCFSGSIRKFVGCPMHFVSETFIWSYLI